MEAHKPDLGIQILGLFNPKQGRKYRTYQFDLLITENEFKHISTKANVKFAVSRMPMNKEGFQIDSGNEVMTERVSANHRAASKVSI